MFSIQWRRLYRRAKYASEGALEIDFTALYPGVTRTAAPPVGHPDLFTQTDRVRASHPKPTHSVAHLYSKENESGK